MNDLEPPEEKPEPISLSAAARAFDIARETMRNRLQQDGAQPTADGLWRIRDVISAMAGNRMPYDQRVFVLKQRIREALAAELMNLAVEVRALPVTGRGRIRRAKIAVELEDLISDARS